MARSTAASSGLLALTITKKPKKRIEKDVKFSVNIEWSTQKLKFYMVVRPASEVCYKYHIYMYIIYI